MMARTSKIGASEVFDCILHVARAFIKKPLHSRYGTAPLQRFTYPDPLPEELADWTIAG